MPPYVAAPPSPPEMPPQAVEHAHRPWTSRFKRLLRHHNDVTTEKPCNEPPPPQIGESLHITAPTLTSSTAHFIDVSQFGESKVDGSCEPPVLRPRSSSLFSWEPHKRVSKGSNPKSNGSSSGQEFSDTSITTAVDSAVANDRLRELELELETSRKLLESEKQKIAFLSDRVRYLEASRSTVYGSDTMRVGPALAEYKLALRRLKKRRDTELLHKALQPPDNLSKAPAARILVDSPLAKRKSPNGMPHLVPIV